MNNHFKTNIEISHNPSDEILTSIANKHGEIADKVFRGLKNIIQKAKSYTGYFCVVLYSENKEVIGFADFIQSSQDFTQWFYTDLWVEQEHRRLGNAKTIVLAGCNYLSSIGAKTLLCTVEPNNVPSIQTQHSLGFKKIKTKPFEFFDNSDLLMFLKEIN